MCGIVGYFSINGYSDSLFDKLDVIKHRGPDGQNVLEYTDANVTVGLGHARLSIIDLSTNASQPFISKCEQYIIVFNGEIYNYKELRKEFDENELRSNSDTEVLLLLYIRYGIQMLNRLEGMFSFVLFDKKKKEVVAARDQLGIKPLYYMVDKGKFLFGSELKVLKTFKDVKMEIDPESLTEFMLNGFLYEPSTGFKGVTRLESGSFMLINQEDKEIKIITQKYWTPFENNGGEQPLLTEIEDEINRSIENHLVSDVPVGLFFSGGTDSSLILNHLKGRIDSIIVKPNENAFAEAGFADDFKYASLIAERLKTSFKTIELNEIVRSPASFLEKIDFLSRVSEELLLDFTFIASQLISKSSRISGFKVMLSGMGADELFGGYPRYRLVRFEKLFAIVNSLIPDFFLTTTGFSKKLDRFRAYFKQKEFVMRYTTSIGYFSVEELELLFGRKINTESYIKKLKHLLSYYPAKISNFKRAVLLDIHGFLAHNFSVADKSSMLESIELRVPLATKSLAELAFRVPESKQISFWETKIILKHLLSKYIGKNLVYRKKTGFNPPLDGYVNSLGYSLIFETLEKNRLFLEFKKEYVIKILEDHFVHTKRNNTYKIYQLLYLSYWLKNNRT